jgi:hypothetical protein
MRSGTARCRPCPDGAPIQIPIAQRMMRQSSRAGKMQSCVSKTFESTRTKGNMDPGLLRDPMPRQECIRCQATAFWFTPFRSATVFSFVLAAFSSLRVVVRKRTTSSCPSSSAQAISVP